MVIQGMECPADLADQMTALPVLIQEGPHMRDSGPSDDANLPKGFNQVRTLLNRVRPFVELCLRQDLSGDMGLGAPVVHQALLPSPPVRPSIHSYFVAV